ncbi:hypothetical protein HDU87_000793 [Geranomyces variabilis]|uniref:G-patch domain-containing protein n=1 Tax=Geranomyces variabilis TaxID=109894 RepID=A0AAD5XT09_9FUNG|nr:hypothetical protein HDU87_000793 [Geranomyces variabilis]
MSTRRQPPGFVLARESQHQKQQQQPSSSTLVTFGTQQPQDLSDVRAKDRNNYLPVHKQEPRDEQGRKRFHGAFTGGFSAGYFNSVGSKEGWAPSQFVSSRNARFDPKNAAARPEDFMDDEDLEAASETRQIAATDEYDILGGTAKEVARKRAAVAAAEGSTGGGGAIAAKIVEDLIGPAKDPIGIKLLRQMGWREGHGVGPRAKRKARKHGPTVAEDEEEDIYAANHTFAPRDVAVDLLRPKTDSFGLGYDPFRQAPEFASRNRPPGPQGNDRDRGAPKQGRAGFGVGVFEDEDEDINVYDSTMASYDMIIDDDDDGPLLKRKLAGAAQGARKPPRDEGISFDLGVSICHDGRPPLEGFELAKKGMPEQKWYQPPDLPPSFVPMHRFDVPLSAAAKSASQPGADAHIHPSRLAKQQGLTADARRDILGEEPLDAPTRSVFSYIALKEQDRLQNFINQTTSAQPARGGGDESLQKEDAGASSSSGPKVEAATALAALKGFMPFGNDPGKQTRYRTFLQVHAGLATEYAPNPKHLTPRDIAHEALEFSKAAQIFKPLSSMMASRFTSASSAIEPSTTADAVAVITAGADTQVQASAAGMGMYGALTRTRSEWRPEPLLCKRFNVPDPYEKKKKRKGGGDRDQGEREREEARARREREEKVFQREALNKDAMSGLMMERDRLVAQGVLKAAPTPPQVSPLPAIEMLEGGTGASERPPPVQDGQGSANGEQDDDDERPEVSERPAMDIFKAIFAESDEDDSESDSEDEKRRPPVSVAPAAAAGTLKPAASVVATPTPPLAAGPALRIEASPPPITPAFRPVFRRKQDRLKGAAVGAVAATPAPAPAATSVAAPQVHPARAARMDVGDSAAASPPATIEHALPPAATMAEEPALQPNRKRARAAADDDDDVDTKDARDGDEDDRLQLGAPPAARKDKKRRKKDKKKSEDGGSKRKRGRDKDGDGRKRRRSELEEEEEDMWVEKVVDVAPPPPPMPLGLSRVRREEVEEEEEEEEDDADTYAPKPPQRAAPRAAPESESADSRSGRSRPSAADFM